MLTHFSYVIFSFMAGFLYVTKFCMLNYSILVNKSTEIAVDFNFLDKWQFS